MAKVRLTGEQRAERASRVRRYDLAERWRAAAVVAAVVASIGLLFSWQGTRQVPPIETRVLASWCRAAYGRARTAAESAAVDLQQPVNDPNYAPARVTCRELRQPATTRP
jgi:hypothetical protein